MILLTTLWSHQSAVDSTSDAAHLHSVSGPAQVLFNLLYFEIVRPRLPLPALAESQRKHPRRRK